MEELNGLADDDEDDDDDNDASPETIPATKYYASRKVLGQLYRAIDEHAFFEEIQRWSRTAKRSQSISLAEKVWGYVHSKTALIQYDHYLRFARDVKEG